jgi:drug/metabolite transporter (DMT)-like permease
MKALSLGADAARLRLTATLSVAAGALLLGLGPILVRHSEFGFQATAFWRFVAAIPALALMAASIERGNPAPGRRDFALLLLAGLFFAGDIGLWHASLERTSVVNATLLSNFAPVLAAAAGWLIFKERLRGGFLMGAALAVCGAALLSLGRAQTGTGSAFGDVLGLCSAVWYAAYLLMMRDLRLRVSVWAAMLVTTLAAAPTALAATILSGEAVLPPSVTAQGWTIVIALGLFVHVGGQGLIAWGLGKLPIARSTILLFLQPVAAAALGWALLGEPLNAAGLAGAAFVLAGVTLAQRARAGVPVAASADPAHGLARTGGTRDDTLGDGGDVNPGDGGRKLHGREGA